MTIHRGHRFVNCKSHSGDSIGTSVVLDCSHISIIFILGDTNTSRILRTLSPFRDYLSRRHRPPVIRAPNWSFYPAIHGPLANYGVVSFGQVASSGEPFASYQELSASFDKFSEVRLIQGSLSP